MAIIKIEGKEEKYGLCHYEYDEADKIGQGGMGEVFLGKRVDSNNVTTRVAIKYLTNTQPEVLAKAREEASIQLLNDNLVYMYGFVEKENEDILTGMQYYVISEYVDGISLASFITGNLESRDGNINPVIQSKFERFAANREAVATEIIKSLLSAIMSLHDAGYIHRDIDQTNIMVTTDGKYRLIDYGVAKKVNELKEDCDTKGKLVGKIEYGAPELIQGYISKQNYSTDIYAIGILYFQLITGHLPFTGDRHEILKQQLCNSLPLKEIKTQWIRGIIKKATEKSQSKRYATAAQFRADVDMEPPYVGLRPPLNWKKVVFVAAAAIAMVVIVMTFVIGQQGSTENGTEIAAQDTTTKLKSNGIKIITKEEVDKQSYAYYLKLLDDNNKDSVEKGFVGMKRLANNSYPDAVYEVAYIYAFNNRAKHQKEKLGIVVDKNGMPISKEIISKGKEWLNKAIETGNPKAYRCQYWLAAYQTDLEQAIKLLQQALNGANKAGDIEYSKKIELNLKQLKK